MRTLQHYYSLPIHKFLRAANPRDSGAPPDGGYRILRDTYGVLSGGQGIPHFIPNRP